MNRAQFIELAELRLKEAETLLSAGLYDGAYYLAGYAVECALKACIAKLTNAHDFPPPKRTIERYYTHDLKTLLDAADLAAAFVTELAGNKDLEVYWDVVKVWSESSRYERKTRAQTESLLIAINDATNGVLMWIRRHW